MLQWSIIPNGARAVAYLQWEAIHVSLVRVGGCCHGYGVSRCGEGAVEARAHGCARFCGGGGTRDGGAW